MGPSLSSTLQPGQSFGRYQIVRTLGVGSFGIVYEAVQYPLGRRVALKLLHDRTLAHPDAHARFEREAMAAARLRHPHSVEVLDYGTHEGVAFLAMELLEGESLQGLMRRAGPLPVETIVDLLLPIVSAVAAVHDAGIVHRDLKPENFLLTVTPEHQWHPKLLDFGIAKLDAQGMELTRTNALLGTPCYMSPEQVMQARSIDGRADQWSIGVVLYEALTGRKPFYSDTLLVLMTAITSEDPPPLRAMRPDVDPALEAVIARAMQRRPEDRYPTMRDLGRALLPFASPAAQQRWYGEFVEGQGPSLQTHTGSLSLPAAQSFSSHEEEGTIARGSQLGYFPEPALAHPLEEPTELVNTTSQDGEFPQGFQPVQGLRASGGASVAQGFSDDATRSHDPAASRTLMPLSNPSGAFAVAPNQELGTGTLAMDIQALHKGVRPQTGKMPAYKATVEMSQPVVPMPPGVVAPGQASGPSLVDVPPHGGAPLPGASSPVLGTAGGPGFGTLNLVSGEVSRPSSASGASRLGGRLIAIVAAFVMLGVGVFAVVFVKSRSLSGATTSSRDDASVRLTTAETATGSTPAVHDAIASPPFLADATMAATSLDASTQEPMADAGAASQTSDVLSAFSFDVTGSGSEGDDNPRSGHPGPRIRTPGHLDHPNRPPRDVGPVRRDAGGVPRRDAGRRPSGPHVPIF